MDTIAYIALAVIVPGMLLMAWADFKKWKTTGSVSALNSLLQNVLMLALTSIAFFGDFQVPMYIKLPIASLVAIAVLNFKPFKEHAA